MPKFDVGYEELWDIVPGGRGLSEHWDIELPQEVIDRIDAADAEWKACLELISDAVLEQFPSK